MKLKGGAMKISEAICMFQSVPVFFGVTLGLRTPHNPSPFVTSLKRNLSPRRSASSCLRVRLTSHRDTRLLHVSQDEFLLLHRLKRPRGTFYSPNLGTTCLFAINKKENIMTKQTPGVSHDLQSPNSTASHLLADDVKEAPQPAKSQKQQHMWSFAAATIPKKSLATNTNFFNHNATLTLRELEDFLRRNEYVTKADLMSSLDKLKATTTTSSDNQLVFAGIKQIGKGSVGPTTSTTSSTSSTSGASSRGGVGMPQQSILTDKLLITSTTFSSGAIGYIVCRSVAANLWLLGLIIGAAYGNTVAMQDVQIRSSIALEGSNTGSNDLELTRGIISKIILGCGRRCGRAVLTVYDAVNVLWYMYNTGKLSYAYYKQYETLDSRFKITDKVDAWNARFQEGKLKFDQWEKENEISSKLLAGLRTFWLVEDRSYKKISKKYSSKNRIVAMANGVSSFVTKFFHAMWKLITGGGNEDLEDLMKGVQADLRELNFEKVGQQLGSGLAALVAVNVVGALFLISPSMVGVICFASGMIWPTWIADAYGRFTKKIKDTANKGRREMALKKSASEGGLYHYFVRDDGTKRWYRTGRPILQSFLIKKEPVEKENNSKKIKGFFSWPAL